MHLLNAKIFSRCCKLKLQVLAFLSTDIIKHMTYKAESIVQQKREQMKMSKLLWMLDFNFKIFKDSKFHKNKERYLIKLQIYLVFI